MLSPANPASEVTLLERIPAHRLWLHKQTNKQRVLHARVLLAVGGVCPQGTLLPELGTTLLRWGDYGFNSRGRKRGHLLSRLSCPAQNTTEVLLVLSACFHGPIRNRSLLTPSSFWHDHRAAQALTKQPKATVAVGVLRLHAHGWRGRNSNLGPKQSLKQTHTQKKKSIKLLLTEGGVKISGFLRNLILLLRAPLGEQPG